MLLGFTPWARFISMLPDLLSQIVGITLKDDKKVLIVTLRKATQILPFTFEERTLTKNTT